MDTAPADDLTLLLRRDALAQGFSDDEIARLRRSGDWGSLQRGAYLLGNGRLDRDTRYRLRVAATLAGLRTPAVVSHVSAAAVHGLPLWGMPLVHVHVTRTPPARSDKAGRLRSHVAALAAEDVVTVDGRPVTSPARTVVDIARSVPFAPALAVADEALREQLTSADELRTALAAVAGTRGSRAAARVVRYADRRSGSVGESRSRALMILGGVPLPDLQVEVSDRDGRRLGLADFGWRDRRLLGEFDGRVKYGRLLRPGQPPGDAVFEEKLREDAMRDVGWGMTRWVWSDLDHPPRFVARLMARLAAAG